MFQGTIQTLVLLAFVLGIQFLLLIILMEIVFLKHIAQLFFPFCIHDRFHSPYSYLSAGQWELNEGIKTLLTGSLSP